MASLKTQSEYFASIGIECHVQLKTKTKLFAAVSNDARGAAPNTLISHICLGMPGALPVLNEKAVEYAVRVAHAFNVKPQKYSYFERKHYFYPDLPKGYQITQLEQPIIKGGYVEITAGRQAKIIRLNRVQIEEDAGKSMHPAGKDYSLVDLNRAGTPLLEIVSEPDIKSPAEAKAYAKELYLLMRYADVSDADLFHGNMRFDVNVSISDDPETLGIRTETKNLNSFRSVEKAVEFEIKRQTKLLEKGENIVQETRGWDDAKQKTFSQRGKEEAHDYRYFPDPDLPPVELDDELVEKVGKEMPKLPRECRDVMRKIGIDSDTVEDVIAVPDISRMVMDVLSKSNADYARRAAFWLLQESPEEESLEAGWSVAVSSEQLIKLSELVQTGKLSSTTSKQVLGIMQIDGGDPAEIATANNLIQVSDEGEIAEVVEKVLADNPKAAEDVKNGEMKAIGFLIGQVMKASKGKANPGLAQQLIKKQLGV